MANLKTFIDTNRLPLNLDRYDVSEVMPGHYDELYPNLTRFLETYYKSLEQDNNPAKLVNDLLTNRDVVSVQQEFLKFLSNELLLGKPYFEQFNDKRTALQFSNLLYRSKGTEYSIQQFFRIFYTLDVDVFYGRDFIFNVGDPVEEKIQYPTRGELTGSTFRYTFQGGLVEVYVDVGSDQWVLLRQDVDYIQNFAEKRIELQVRPLDQYGYPQDGFGFAGGIVGNPILTDLAENATIGYADAPMSERLRIVTVRSDNSTIGSSSVKRITNDKFYQLFALMIQTPVGVDIWKEAYKTFVHPAGMYLAGRVQIVSVADMGMTGGTLIDVPIIDNVPVAKVFKNIGKGLSSTDITERGPGPFGYEQRSRPNDFMRETYHWQHSDLLEIGTQDSDKEHGWGRQYLQIFRANDINARRLDDTYITLTNTINTIDENIYTEQDSDGQGNPWLPGEIEIRPEDVFQIISTEDGVFIQTEDGRLISI